MFVFAGVALFLASIGLSGLLPYTTDQGTKEIAVRLALGDERHAVVRMVVAQGERFVAIGLAGKPSRHHFIKNLPAR
jgi:putative ABC transport system permease protein